MSVPIAVEFSLRQEIFLANFNANINENPQFNRLEINNTPTVQNGYDLLIQSWFNSQVCDHQNLKGIIIKVNEKVNNEKYLREFGFKNSFLIAFQSTHAEHESKIYWKVPECETFYSLYIDSDETGAITSFCHEFLIKQIKNGKSGVLDEYLKKRIIRLNEIGDVEGNDLLFLATKDTQLDAVKGLLSHDLDPNDVIDLAWDKFIETVDETRNENEASKIVESLLKANSSIPNRFDYDQASNEVQNFIDLWEKLHVAVAESDFEELKRKLDENPDLTYFYNRYNQSLLGYALTLKRFEIFNFLDKSISIGGHEDLHDIYGSMSENNRKVLKTTHKLNARDSPRIHLHVLKSKCRIGNNDRNAHKRWTLIGEAFETLNRNTLCSKILKIAAEWNKTKIFFDFKHDSVYYLDPDTDYNTQGIIHDGKTIYIGAKGLLNDANKHEVFGILAHELCHLSMYASFMNSNCDPYPMGESEMKKIFIKEVMTECEDKKSCERIVKGVFKYDESDIHSEMIVTVPEMLMTYAEDEEKIQNLKNNFKELFKYTCEVVESVLDDALKVLKLLNDKDREVKFEEVTKPMKAKILNDKLEFQKEITSLLKLIGNDNEILKHLSSKMIRKILLENKMMKFGEICKLKLKYKFDERSFIEYNQIYSKTYNNKEMIEHMNSHENTSKVFILADHAGTGKTTTFKNYARKLKQNFKDFWVSFVDLRKFEHIFEKFNGKTENMSIQEVIQIFSKIVVSNIETADRTSEIEVEIFKKLFSKNKVILLLDGVDEICPKYTQLLIKMFTVYKESKAKNQLWISTRPHYGRKLSSIFEVNAYEFKSYSNGEIKSIIRQILDVNRVNDTNEQDEIIGECIEFLNNFDGSYWSFSKREIDNPLMVRMITELYIKDPKYLEWSNLYGLYSAMLKNQKDELGQKVSNENCDRDLKLNIWMVHMVLALKAIIGNNINLEFDLNDLTIMKIWKVEKEHWIADMIQRYGFVNVDFDVDPEDERRYIDFMHRSYGEFFVAKYLIESIFDDNFIDSDEEIGRKFQLLLLILKVDNYELIRDFIFSYMANKARASKKVFHRKIKCLITEKIQQLHDDLRNLKRPNMKIWFRNFESYAQIALNDEEIVNMMWKLNQPDDFLKELLLSECFKVNSIVLRLVEYVLDSNWPEKFNKSDQKLITDEEIDNFKDESDNVMELTWNDNKNFLKLCDLIDKNFDESEKRVFYNNLGLESIDINKIFIEIRSRMKESLGMEETAVKSIFEPYYRNLNEQTLKIIFDDFDLCNLNYETKRKKLFLNYPNQKSPLIKAIITQDSQTFNVVKEFYIKYKVSWQEVQKVLTNCQAEEFLAGIKSKDFYPEFKKFLIDVFGSDFTPLQQLTESYILWIIHEAEEDLAEYDLEILEDFLIIIYSSKKKLMKFWKKLKSANCDFTCNNSPHFRKLRQKINFIDFFKARKLHQTPANTAKNV